MGSRGAKDGKMEGGGDGMDVSNWVILSILLGYTLWTSVLYILVGGDCS